MNLYYEESGVAIFHGDALETLREMDDESADCCVTSPPYWGLRDYDVHGQIGLERTPGEYVVRLVEVFREVRRVLTSAGVLFLVLGDSYARDAKKGQHKPGDGGMQDYVIRRGGGRAASMLEPGDHNLKPKDLVGIPWSVAFALRDDGWYLRSDIIWSKPNCLPESVNDRPTKCHEYVFMLARSERYYYDAKAVAEPAVSSRGDEMRNRRSVWTIPTRPFSGAHFAVFPEALAEVCILAGTPAGGVVLDPFGGAGTVGVVAGRLGRRAMLVELKEEYCELAAGRLARSMDMNGNERMAIRDCREFLPDPEAVKPAMAAEPVPVVATVISAQPGPILLNTVTQGNCLDLLPRVASASVDMVMTSPPYDNLRTYKGYSFDFEGVARELYRVLKPGGVVVWVVADATQNGSETGTSFKQALYFKECGFNLHDTMIWNKGCFAAVGALAAQYAPVFEYMFVLSKGRPKTFNPLKDKPNKTAGSKVHGVIRQQDGSVKPVSNNNVVKEFGQRFNVWELPPECNSKKYGHPAMYPVRLAADQISSWSNPGDTVLDPFFGSGTTGVACQQLGRNFIGLEISPEYCEIARQRLLGPDAEAHPERVKPVTVADVSDNLFSTLESA